MKNALLSSNHGTGLTHIYVCVCIQTKKTAMYLLIEYMGNEPAETVQTHESPRKMERGEKRGIQPIGLDLPVADTISA